MAIISNTVNYMDDDTVLVVYDFGTGNYFLAFLPGPYSGEKYVEPAPASEWLPDALAGEGVR